MYHFSLRFYIAPRSDYQTKYSVYVWYITSLCWNIKWKTRPRVNILLVGVWMSVETVLVLIHSFSVVEYRTKHSPHVSYMSCTCTQYWDIRGNTPFCVNFFFVSFVKSHTRNIYYFLVFRYQTKHPSRH